MDRSPRAARHVYRRRRVKAPGRGQDRWFFHPLYRNYVHEATADIYSRASLVAESATSKQWDLVKYVATARSAMRSCPRRRRTLMRRHCSRSPASASPTRWSCRLWATRLSAWSSKAVARARNSSSRWRSWSAWCCALHDAEQCDYSGQGDVGVRPWLGGRRAEARAGRAAGAPGGARADQGGWGQCSAPHRLSRAGLALRERGCGHVPGQGIQEWHMRQQSTLVIPFFFFFHFSSYSTVWCWIVWRGGVVWRGIARCCSVKHRTEWYGMEVFRTVWCGNLWNSVMHNLIDSCHGNRDGFVYYCLERRITMLNC